MGTPRRTTLGLGLLLATCVLFAPSASAHTTVEAADGMLCITVGHLNEPVATYYMSGLDLAIRQKHDPSLPCSATVERDGEQTSNRGVGVRGMQNNITEAILVAPSGAERDQMPLQVPHGAGPGLYTGAEPYVLTEPGQYKLRLVGEWEGRDISGTYDVSGEFDDSEGLLFPQLDEGANIAALQERVSALESEVEQMRSSDTETEAQDSPTAALALLATGLLVAAFIVRRRA